MPSRLWGSGPKAPSVYCLRVQRGQIFGTSGALLYWAIHSQHLANSVCDGLVIPALVRASLMVWPE